MTSFFLLASLSLAFFCMCQADLISNVCSKAVNPSLCTQTLRSDPRSGGADVKGLGQIAVGKSVTLAQAAIGVYKSNNNAKNKQIIDVCIETTTDAIDALKSIDFKTGSKADILNKGSGASTNVGTCDDEFGSSEPPPVKAATKKATDVISIVLTIAKSL